MKRTAVFLVVVAAMALASYPPIGIGFDLDVYQFQSRLKDLGYDTGPLDGQWGPKAQEAVKNFQKDNGLAVSGKVDKKTRELLRPIEVIPDGFTEVPRSSREEEIVKSLQRLGFPEKKSDGEA